jgi:hypothetical protein
VPDEVILWRAISRSGDKGLENHAKRQHLAIKLSPDIAMSGEE